MKPLTRIILITLTIIFTIAFLLMAAISVSMLVEYRGQTMGNEAFGFYSTAVLITIIIGIPTFILWVVLLKNKTTKKRS